MLAIEVIYENGVLRPLHPLDLDEGTRLEVTVAAIAPPSNAQEPEIVDEAEYAAFLAEMDAIAALPLQGPAQRHTARDHDAILYPKHGPVP